MLAYIDESGFPHPNDPTLRPVLAAVCIPRAEMRYVVQKLYNIKLDIYGKTDVELKAANVLKAKSLTTNSDNKLFAERVVNEVLVGTQDLGFFAVVMEKPAEAPSFGRDEFPSYYRYLLQRINGYSNQYEQKCVIAFDSRDEGNDMLISMKMKNYLFRSLEGRQCDSIVESAFFVNSKVEDGIQLADFCAGLTRLRYEMWDEENEFALWIKELYEKIAALTVSVQAPGGGIWLYGVYQMPSHLLCRDLHAN